MGLLYQKKKRGPFYARDLSESYQNIKNYAAATWIRFVREATNNTDTKNNKDLTKLVKLEEELIPKSAKMLSSQKIFLKGRSEIKRFWWENAKRIETECFAIVNYYPVNILNEFLSPMKKVISRYSANNKIPPKFKILLRNNDNLLGSDAAPNNPNSDSFLEIRKLRQLPKSSAKNHLKETLEEIFVADHKFAMTVHHNFETSHGFFSSKNTKLKIASITENPEIISALKKTFFMNWHFRSSRQSL